MKRNEAPERLLRSRVEQKCLMREGGKGEGGEADTRCANIGGIWAVERSNPGPEGNTLFVFSSGMGGGGLLGVVFRWPSPSQSHLHKNTGHHDTGRLDKLPPFQQSPRLYGA
ncbi:hypothetical protein O3P69_010278 [Scylla paramamosain]|uniref:Uncharacterized protein n=1 Tax=Scylla paramamosain TaxID=85552 RepID=A0AAW0TSW7_SCYPA